MKNRFMSLALLFAIVLAFNGVCFGWGAAGGDGTNYRALQETAVFLNMSDTTLTGGQVVVLDVTEGSTGTTLGSYVEGYSGADSIMVVGVVAEGQSSLDSTPVVVVTKGPVKTFVVDNSDSVSASTAVGTGTSAAAQGCIYCAGGGTNLGIALEAGVGNGDTVIVWVDPTGAD